MLIVRCFTAFRAIIDDERFSIINIPFRVDFHGSSAMWALHSRISPFGVGF